MRFPLLAVTPRRALACLALILCVAMVSVAAQDATKVREIRIPHDEFPLWSKGAPGARGQKPQDIPTLTPYLVAPERMTGAVVIICPGGSYGSLSSYEGTHYALWLNEYGVTAFVLKYRLGTNGYHHPIMMQDAQRAIRLVRFHAVEWQLDPNRIGILGSSAGGHLAATCLTHTDAGDPAATDPIDRVSSRPDLGILCYPVITMGPESHAYSRENLLGKNPDPALIESLSCERHVTKDTPPTFLFHTVADAGVSVENSRLFANAMRRVDAPVEYHEYPDGAHGIGLGSGWYWEPDRRHPWTAACAAWLKKRGFTR
jgi:acetyl esterase/lipase